MSSISRSLVIFTVKLPPGPAVRAGPFQSSAGCLTKSASRRLRLKPTTIPVSAATPGQRRTWEITRSWRCVLNFLSLTRAPMFSAETGKLGGGRRRKQENTRQHCLLIRITEASCERAKPRRVSSSTTEVRTARTRHSSSPQL